MKDIRCKTYKEICELLGVENLQGVDLSWTDLQDCDLRDADLQSCDLRGADLSGADLTGADLRGVKLDVSDLLHLGWVTPVKKPKNVFTKVKDFFFKLFQKG